MPWVEVAVTPDRLRATILCDHLRAHGIEALVRGDGAGSEFLTYQNASARGASVWVPPDEAARASEILDEFGPMPRAKPPAWLPFLGAAGVSWVVFAVAASFLSVP